MSAALQGFKIKPDNALKSAGGMRLHFHRHRAEVSQSQDKLGHCEPPGCLTPSWLEKIWQPRQSCHPSSSPSSSASALAQLGFGTMHSWASPSHTCHILGKASSWESFASGIQPPSLRGSVSESLGSSQPSPAGSRALSRTGCSQSQHPELRLLHRCCDNPVCSVLVTEGSHNQGKQQDYPPAPVPTERIITAGCINDVLWASPSSRQPE